MSKSLPKGWKIEKIGNLCEVGRGSSPRPIVDSKYFEGGTIPWIKIADATKSGKYLYETKEKVNKYGASFSRLLPKGSLIVAASGTLGYTQILGVDGCIHDGWLYLSNFQRVNKDFLYYLLQWRKDYFYNSAYGAAIQNVNTIILREMEIMLPPLHTQLKIASILSAYDDLIENNTRRIQILEEMAQAIYKEWFVNFRFPEHEKVKMIESELGLIPQGWEVKRLKELVEPQYGYTESATEEQIGPKFLRGTDVNKSTYINWDSVPFCKIDQEDFEKYRLKIGDIVIIRMADPGKIGIVEAEVNAIFASYLIRLKIKSDSIRPYYLFHFLSSEKYQNYIKGASTGTTRKSASAGVVTDIDLCIPPLRLIIEFENNVYVLRKQLNLLLEKNNNLRHTRDLLLPKLISGEIDVEGLDIDINGVMT